MPGPIYPSGNQKNIGILSLGPTKQQAGILSGLNDDHVYRGSILPFEKNMETGEVSLAVPGMLSGLIDSAAGAITAPYRAMTGDLPMTDDAGRTSPQAIAAASDMAGFVSLGAAPFPATANDLRMGIKLMHSSPHDFDTFERSAKTRFTGEGTGVFGDGLYFAENPETAKSYARQFIDSHGKSVSYKIDLDVEDNSILDLEKPLSEQPKKVRDLVISILPKKVSPVDWWGNFDGSLNNEIDKKNAEALSKLTGGEAYAMLVKELGGKVEASDALEKAGVPAMKYLDAGSRGAGAGTSNYIVLDASKAKILGKEKLSAGETL